MRAIIKLERGIQDIPVLTKLQPKLSELKKRAGFKLLSDQEHKKDYGYEPSLTVKYLNSWIKAKNCAAPTWKNFLKILKDISPDLSKLSDQIELYITGKGGVSHQVGDGHVIKHDNTTNLIENEIVGNQTSQNGYPLVGTERTISVNPDSERKSTLEGNSRNQKHQEITQSTFHNQKYNSQSSRDSFVGMRTIPDGDESDLNRSDDIRDQKYHQVDRKPDSENNQNSLLIDKLEIPDDIKGDKKHKDLPNNEITSHGLIPDSYKPSINQQFESTSKLAPKWMQEPDNELTNGQTDSKHQLQGVNFYAICDIQLKMLLLHMCR